MPAPKRSPVRKLPAITVARFEAALALFEALADDEVVDMFIAKGQSYRERHRDGTERRLTAQEAAQVAAGMASGEGLPPVALAVAVQESDLRAYDEPEPVEILLRAGIATAPAAMHAVQRFVALIEMPAEAFTTAREADGLDDALDEAAKAAGDVDFVEARARAQAAFAHFAQAAGAEPGKALSLIPRGLWQAMEQAMISLGLQRAPSSLTGSPPSTDGLAETSNTTSATSAR